MQFTDYVEFGSHSVSRGAFLKAGTFVAYHSNKNKVAAGLQYDLAGYGTSFFSGLNIDGSREFQIKKCPIELHALFRWNRATDYVRETNWGAYGRIKRKKWIFSLGWHWRTFALSAVGMNKFRFQENTRIHENRNLIYSIAYYIKPLDHEWNIGFCFTNVDRFLLNQETNPMMNVHATVQVKPRLRYFLEAWYKSAGSMNIAVDHFGFFIRTGIVWDIKD